jgi:hypothetical protein
MLLKLGTNGSYNMVKEMASFGWMLIGNQNVLIQGAGPVDGVPTILSSTRVELFRIAAPNEFLFHFMKFHKIESTSKCMKCVDNKAESHKLIGHNISIPVTANTVTTWTSSP